MPAATERCRDRRSRPAARRESRRGRVAVQGQRHRPKGGRARSCAAQRIRCGARRVDDSQLTVGDHLGLEVRLRSESEEADLSRAQHWSGTGERGEPVGGALDVEHVRHPHPVQGPVDRAVGHIEIGVPIGVDDTQPLDTILIRPATVPDTDRAVASENHDHVLGWGRSDQCSDLAGTVDDRAGVRCPGVLGVRHATEMGSPARRGAPPHRSPRASRGGRPRAGRGDHPPDPARSHPRWSGPL